MLFDKKPVQKFLYLNVKIKFPHRFKDAAHELTCIPFSVLLSSEICSLNSFVCKKLFACTRHGDSAGFKNITLVRGF